MGPLSGRKKKEEVLLANILGDCLDALEAGSDPQDVLARHPETADEVEPLLDVALMLRECRGPLVQKLAPRRVPGGLHRHIRLRWHGRSLTGLVAMPPRGRARRKTTRARLHRRFIRGSGVLLLAYPAPAGC